MWSACAASWTARVSSSRSPSSTRSSSSWVPVSENGIWPAESWSSTPCSRSTPIVAQPAVRKRQREGQADPAEADDGNARFHAAAVYLRSLRYWRANASTKRGLK